MSEASAKNKRKGLLTVGAILVVATSIAVMTLVQKPAQPAFLDGLHAEPLVIQLMPVGSGPVFIGTWNVPMDEETFLKQLRPRLPGWSEAEYVGGLPKMTEFRAPTDVGEVEKVLIERGRTSLDPKAAPASGSWVAVTVQYRPSSAANTRAKIDGILFTLGIPNRSASLYHRSNVSGS